MKIKNDQAGLTLVELLVTILVGSIVTLAATTVLLLGLRINNQSTQTNTKQNTVQILMEALENVASEAKKLQVTDNPDSWVLADDGKVLFSYKSAEQTIYSGESTPFLTGVYASFATLDENNLLTFSVETKSGSYTTSVYCRLQKEVTVDDFVEKIQLLLDTDGSNDWTFSGDAKVNDFLTILAKEYGSRGEIRNGDGTYKYYSEWYLEDQNYTNHSQWNKDTPWCACYISWALEKAGHPGNIRLAHVDKLMVKVGCQTSGSVGDLVFFDWDGDQEPQHVGVVLSIEGDCIYTIEGNTAGKVAVRKYITDDYRILGYGRLNWAS